MNIMELGAIGELVGGSAVLVTLVYLAVQVRHARGQVNEQSVATALGTMQDAFVPIYEGSNLQVFRKGIDGKVLQDDDEELLFRLLMARLVTAAMTLARTDDPKCWEYISALRETVFDRPGARVWIDELPTTSPLKKGALKAFELAADQASTSEEA